MQLVGRIRAGGVTIIMVEHVMKAVLGLSDRVIVLSSGQKIAEGHPQAIIRDKRVIEVFLGDGKYAED